VPFEPVLLDPPEGPDVVPLDVPELPAPPVEELEPLGPVVVELSGLVVEPPVVVVAAPLPVLEADDADVPEEEELSLVSVEPVPPPFCSLQPIKGATTAPLSATKTSDFLIP
jgi:hypothetical protein